MAHVTPGEGGKITWNWIPKFSPRTFFWSAAELATIRKEIAIRLNESHHIAVMLSETKHLWSICGMDDASKLSGIESMASRTSSAALPLCFTQHDK
jgi:hypothetical protein